MSILTSVGGVGVDRGLELVDQRDGRGGLLGRVADQGLRAVERPTGLGGRRAFVDRGVRRVRERLEFKDLVTDPLEGVEGMHASAGFLRGERG